MLMNGLEEFYIELNKNIELASKYGFKGNLYRIHTPYTALASENDRSKEYIVGEVCEDGSCSVLKETQYNNKIASFSKSYDFTRDVFYKISSNEKCNIIHVITGIKYGIDVTKVIGENRFKDEQEVLFPLDKKFLLKEYKNITPIKFKEIIEKQ